MSNALNFILGTLLPTTIAYVIFGLHVRYDILPYLHSVFGGFFQ